MKFELTILGAGSALPTLQHHLSAQLINIQENYFLIDCGEGTQLQLRKNKIKFQRINQIFISHLHGDHYLGLMGLISTYNLLGRQKTLTVYSPQLLQEVIELQLKAAGVYLGFKLEFVVIDTKVNKVIYENDKILVETIPLKHRVPCSGFLFREKEKALNLDISKVEKYNIPQYFYTNLKMGEDYTTQSGEIIRNDKLTLTRKKSYSYAYCSDTAYSEEIIPIIKGVDLLYHEATFMEEHKERAQKTKHSTARQAGTIAKKAGVGKLLIGHFSARYKNERELLDEAKQVFPNSALAVEGKRFLVG